MFAAQSAQLMATLATVPADAGALAHTLKGSARAIGAFGVAEAAARLEAVLADGSRSVQPGYRARRCRCAGAGGDRGGPAPVLKRACDPTPPKPRQISPLGFRPERWRCADRPVIGLPGTLLPYSGSTSDHGQNPLCRPFRRNTNHRSRKRRDRDGSRDPQRHSRASKPNAAEPAPARPATSMSTKPGAKRSARPRRWKRTCWISASTCGRTRACRARSRSPTNSTASWSRRRNGRRRN